MDSFENREIQITYSKIGIDGAEKSMKTIRERIDVPEMGSLCVIVMMEGGGGER